MCIRLAHLLRILLVSIKPVQASKAAGETIVYVYPCTEEYMYVKSVHYRTDTPLRYW